MTQYRTIRVSEETLVLIDKVSKLYNEKYPEEVAFLKKNRKKISKDFILKESLETALEILTKKWR